MHVSRYGPATPALTATGHKLLAPTGERFPDPAPARFCGRASGRQQHKRRSHMPHRLSTAITAVPRLVISGAILAAIVALLMWSNATSPALAAGCVVSIGVTQTATTVTGTAGNDTIDCGASTSAMTVTGNGGNDTITGSAFVDTLNGNDGNDTMTGGIGNDTLNGGNNDDTLNGSAGNDKLRGDAGNDTLNGGDDIDDLDGGTGADIIHGDLNSDKLTGPPTDSAIDQLIGDSHDGPPSAGDVCTAGGAVPFTDVLTTCNP
jgi:Ca2+-binding RTX toxin-like protein